jgi:hypothetical protein
MDRHPPDTHYDALQVGPDASADEVRQAYRRLAQQHHPDRSDGGGDGTMARINQAYEVLSDPHLRSEYDFKLRVAATRQARGRMPLRRMSSKPWLMLWAVLTLTVLALGWVAFRVLAPKPAAAPALSAQPTGPAPDDPLPLIPARSIQPWTPPAPADAPRKP